MGVSKVNFGGDTLIDLTNDSVDAASLLKGKTAHNAAGEQVVGTLDVKGTFYVTLTQGDGTSATADKTAEEVYTAYAAGYAVYALVKLRNYDYPYILPLSAVSNSEDEDMALGFTAAGSESPTKKPLYVSASFLFNTWSIWCGPLARPEDIPTIPTALKNPNSLTIKIGSTTVTYDGSTAQTVTIDDGSEVAY